VIKEKNNSCIISGFWCKSSSILGLILLLLSVCPPLYKYSEAFSVHQERLNFNGVIHSSDSSKFNSSSKFNGIHSTDKTDKSGSVSLFHLPSRDESGSYAHFSNDAKGNTVFCYYLGMFGDHFKHVFSLIGLTGAELRPVKGLSKKNLVYELLFVPDLFNSCQKRLSRFSQKIQWRDLQFRQFKIQWS
jgi:hypothetical protein